MTFAGLVARNVWSRKSRSVGICLAVALAVMTVVTLAVTSNGLESSATAIISIGRADFTVAQKGTSDILESAIDQTELRRIARTPGVARTVGVLVETEHLNADNPVFIEIGIAPQDLAAFGVQVVRGHAYQATAPHQCMLGWRAAANLGLGVGSRFRADGTWNTVTGLYSTGNAFGDSGAMFPLPAIQGYNRVPGIVTLVFVRVASGVKAATVAKRIDYNMPELATITTASQFGRSDRTLVFLQAAVNGSTVLAVVIGAIIVANTMLLSLFERTREFGVLRAIGWTHRRTIALLFGETLLLTLLGLALGVCASVVVARILESLPALRGILHVSYTADAFARAMITALAMTIVGGLYPILRAAFLSPLRALSHE